MEDFSYQITINDERNSPQVRISSANDSLQKKKLSAEFIFKWITSMIATDEKFQRNKEAWELLKNLLGELENDEQKIYFDFKPNTVILNAITSDARDTIFEILQIFTFTYRKKWNPKFDDIIITITLLLQNADDYSVEIDLFFKLLSSYDEIENVSEITFASMINIFDLLMEKFEYIAVKSGYDTLAHALCCKFLLSNLEPPNYHPLTIKFMHILSREDSNSKLRSNVIIFLNFFMINFKNKVYELKMKNFIQIPINAYNITHSLDLVNILLSGCTQYKLFEFQALNEEDLEDLKQIRDEAVKVKNVCLLTTLAEIDSSLSNIKKSPNKPKELDFCTGETVDLCKESKSKEEKLYIQNSSGSGHSNDKLSYSYDSNGEINILEFKKENENEIQRIKNESSGSDASNSKINNLSSPKGNSDSNNLNPKSEFKFNANYLLNLDEFQRHFLAFGKDYERCDSETRIEYLEGKYVELAKEINEGNLELDRMRKENREKRHLYLEHKLKVERRKDRLKRKQSIYHETSEKFTEYKKVSSEVSKLRAKLNLLTSSYEKSMKDNTDLVLQEQYRQYQDTLSELQFRKRCALAVLEKPLNFSIVEEILSTQLEDEVESTSTISNSMIEEKDYYLEFQKIEELVQDNDIRRASLEKRWELLKQERAKYKSIKFKKQNPPKINSSVTINYTANLSSCDDEIQEIIKLLNSKREKLNNFKQRTKDMEAKYMEVRTEIEEKYNKKNKQIQKMKKRFDAIGIINDVIRDIIPKNQVFKSHLLELQNERARIERRIENILRDKEMHSKREEQLKLLRDKYNEKNSQYEEKQKSIKIRYEKLNSTLQVYEKEDLKLDDYEERVRQLEDEVKSLENSNQNAIRKVKIFKSDTDFVKASYAALHRNDSVPTIELGLEKTFEDK
ncbi:hypothetical protein TVAG_064200 [Trichomonas vaginalis G3]|uniref:Uncharacterized protein n=1 Tax=Trichomonas vaginalis (strain ATCC PRA-98 / G3) TaxID=412133 RepID=A2FBY0_TRIV3|nr:hypothetical protein TVAGG3_0488650 [Trichomonas vaginalis G3]EAX97579.1 hypothetical protein TVAG_064200 [Trichomonas vaginalis G3]KAI5516220.1 hypothetical protein TVAGG3_0488650 [Trichomonas vaginalis G3]|eukprot:XP_001310509.1 hypothetical protein [Trichomonas vaginalis G3]